MTARQMSSANLAGLLADHDQSANAVLVWAELTATDLRSEFDILDSDFDYLVSMAKAETEEVTS